MERITVTRGGDLVWSAEDLEVRLCRALDLAEKVLDNFAVDGFVDAETPVYNFGPEKAIAETAMLAYTASSVSTRPAVKVRVDALARHLTRVARSDRMLVELALHPSLAFKFALPHILLSHMGYRDAEFDGFLRVCLSADTINGHDRSPTAALERDWLYSLWSGNGSIATVANETTHSILNGPLDILGGLRDDVYAFTHVMFYISDFGNTAPTLPRPQSVLLAEAEGLLARYIDAEDYDLTGEILLAWPFTQVDWSPAAAFTFRVLARVEDAVGLLPCGNVDLHRLARFDGADRSRYALGMAYHTAYVMGFLSAAALRTGRTPPSRIIGWVSDSSCVEQVLKYLDDDQGHWQTDFASLPADEQRALTSFALSIALIQKCRRRDYQSVLELLRIAADHQLAAHPVCRQAAELLDRIAGCSSVLTAVLRKNTQQQSLIPQSLHAVRRIGE